MFKNYIKYKFKDHFNTTIANTIAPPIKINYISGNA